MVRGLCRVALALSCISCLLVNAIASEWPSKPDGLQGSFTRRMLERNGTISSSTTSSEATRFTGALALYSLFGLFVLSSIMTCVIGIIVTLQWPNPRICCYRTPYSDIPSSESCGCCALHRLNIGFAVTWVALLVLLVLALIIYLMAAAAVLAIIHAAIAYRLVRQLKASYGANPEFQMAVALEGGGGAPPPGLVTGVPVDCPLPGVPVPGIPVISVPMSVAVVAAQLQTHVNYGNGNRSSSRLRSGDGNSGSSGGSRSGRRRASGSAWQLGSAAAVAEGGRQAGDAAATSAGPATAWQWGPPAAEARLGAIAPGGEDRVSSGNDRRPAASAPSLPPEMPASSASHTGAERRCRGDGGGDQGAGGRPPSAVVGSFRTTQQQQQQQETAPVRGGWLPAGEDPGQQPADRSSGNSGGGRGVGLWPDGGAGALSAAGTGAATSPHAESPSRGGRRSRPPSWSGAVVPEPVGSRPSTSAAARRQSPMLENPPESPRQAD